MSQKEGVEGVLLFFALTTLSAHFSAITLPCEQVQVPFPSPFRVLQSPEAESSFILLSIVEVMQRVCKDSRLSSTSKLYCTGEDLGVKNTKPQFDVDQ